MRVISARHRGQLRPSSRTRSAQAEQKRWWPHGAGAIRGFRGASRHTYLAVVGVCLRWRVWCGADLTFGLAVGIGHGIASLSSSLSELSSPSSTAGPSYGQLLSTITAWNSPQTRIPLGCRLWIAAEKSVSRIFMSRIFSVPTLTRYRVL